VEIVGFVPIYKTHDPAVKEADDTLRRRKQVETQIAAQYRPGKKSARGAAASSAVSPRKGQDDAFNVKTQKGTALVQLENSQFVFDLSAEDKARLVKHKAGPDEYAELDFELVQPLPAGKRKTVARGGATGAGSKLSVGDARSA
tara:strand:+ start:790 stop:1221 length:432 start_codon:yes stop_codon:yes gene_type:complete